MSPPGFSILRTIAAGGMGTVYLARRAGIEGFARLVALKRAHSYLESDPTFRKRLVGEAAAASRIHHANVVSVIDVVAHGDELWLVLEWVDGASLSRLVALSPDRRVPPAIAARIVIDACTGLATAHDLVGEDGAPAGLRHRDVSPQNILVGRDGVARLADFGLAKTSDATLTATSDRMLEGKLGYLAPELFAGKAFEQPGDQYAMAVVIWEALAGRRLFNGRTLSELTLEQGRAPLLSSIATDVGTGLDAIIERALDLDPSVRYPSVRAMLGELEAAAKRSAILATPLDVARWMARTLDGQAEPAEEPARTPTTGALVVPVESRPVSSPIADDAPTPIAADDVLRSLRAAPASTLESPRETFAPTGRIAKPVESAGPVRNRGRTLAAAAGAVVILGVCALVLGRAFGDGARRPAQGPIGGDATATAPARNASPPLSGSTAAALASSPLEPLAESQPSASSASATNTALSVETSDAVVDLDAPSRGAPVDCNGPRTPPKSRGAKPPEPTTTVHSVPKNPYRP